MNESVLGLVTLSSAHTVDIAPYRKTNK